LLLLLLVVPNASFSFAFPSLFSYISLRGLHFLVFCCCERRRRRRENLGGISISLESAFTQAQAEEEAEAEANKHVCVVDGWTSSGQWCSEGGAVC
jgi:hypothetical protein